MKSKVFWGQYGHLLGDEFISHKPWLTEVKRLSGQLRESCEEWSLKVLYNGGFKPLDDEKELLSIKENAQENAYHGRVIIHCNNGRPIILARVVMPDETYSVFKDQLDAVKYASIGEAFLFQRDDVERSAFKYACVDANDLRFHDFIREADIDLKQVPARASVFILKKRYPILISEYFLSELPKIKR